MIAANLLPQLVRFPSKYIYEKWAFFSRYLDQWKASVLHDQLSKKLQIAWFSTQSQTCLIRRLAQQYQNLKIQHFVEQII